MAREVVQKTAQSPFILPLSAGSSVKESQVWSVTQALQCPSYWLHGFTQVGWHYRASKDSGSDMFFPSLTAVLLLQLLYLLMETNSFLNPYCLKQYSRKNSKLYIFFFHIVCAGIFPWIPSMLSIFALQFQIQSFVWLCLVPLWLPIIRDLAGTIRNQQNWVGSFNFWSLSPISFFEKVYPGYK